MCALQNFDYKRNFFLYTENVDGIRPIMRSKALQMSLIYLTSSGFDK